MPTLMSVPRSCFAQPAPREGSTEVAAPQSLAQFRWLRRSPVALALSATALWSTQALAFGIPMEDHDIAIRWDNTLKYSTGLRLRDADPRLAGTTTDYLDNGDRNFKRNSVIANRVDLLTELDASYKRFGVRLSGAGWYDGAYTSHNDNPGPQSPFSSQAYNDFPESVKSLHGHKAELLDAFVYGSGNLTDDASASFRLGRHSFQWGESAFFGANGIAGTMAPIDLIKALSVPGTQFKDLLMKVPQVSGTVSFGSNVSVAGYYQYGWRASRLPAAGSYFSADTDMGPGVPALQPRNTGQYGFMGRYVPTNGEVEYGLYYTRFHSKTPDGVYLQALQVGAPAPIIIPQVYYHQDASALGASVSVTHGELNVGAEASVRHNAALPSVPGFPVAPGSVGNDASSAAYAIGRTGHLQASISYSLPRTGLYEEALLLAEVAWNRRLSVQKNPASVDPATDRDAWAFQFAVSPTYRQVISALDVSIPISASYTHGKSGAIGPALGADRGGFYSVGVSATYLSAYNFGIAYTDYYGPTGTGLYDQNLRDRRFISAFVSTTF